MHRSSLLALLGLLLVSCHKVDNSSAIPTAAPASSATSAQPNELETAKVAQAPAGLVQTQALSPQPIKITPASLPKPYASSSASKSPNVIPIPSKPTLKVPTGFVVSVFAEGLDRPVG